MKRTVSILGLVLLLAAAVPSLLAAQDVLDDLVMANKILFSEKVVDAFGHISVRNPANPNQFFMARGIQPPFVTREDIMVFDLEGNQVDKAQTGKPSIERFIYSEIYKVRPDVMAIVHSHAEEVLPFTTVKDVPLRALTHNGGMLGSGAPVFDIRDYAGPDSNMLVGDQEPGGRPWPKPWGKTRWSSCADTA